VFAYPAAAPAKTLLPAYPIPSFLLSCPRKASFSLSRRRPELLFSLGRRMRSFLPPITNGTNASCSGFHVRRSERYPLSVNAALPPTAEVRVMSFFIVKDLSSHLPFAWFCGREILPKRFFSSISSEQLFPPPPPAPYCRRPGSSRIFSSFSKRDSDCSPNGLRKGPPPPRY